MKGNLPLEGRVMRTRRLDSVIGLEGPDSGGTPTLMAGGSGQRVLREGSSRIRRLLACSRIAEAAGFKATPPDPVRKTVLRRVRVVSR